MEERAAAQDVKQFYKIIAENLIGLRGKMSQEDLAAKSGVSRSTISKAEAGKGCSLHALFKLAKALDVSPGDLCISKNKKDELSAMAALFVERIMEFLPDALKDQIKK